MTATPDSIEPRGLLGDGLRYAIAAAAASGVDLAVAWTAHAWLSVPLPLAAACGVLAGGLSAYLLLEFWAFRREASAFSGRRLSGLLALVALTLLLRTGFVALVAGLLPGKAFALPILVAAFGLTFTVNFAVNRLVIFRGAGPSAGVRQT